MLNDLDREINVQFRPVEVAKRWLFDAEDFSDRYILEPREIVVRHKQLLVPRQQPYTVAGNVRVTSTGEVSLPSAFKLIVVFLYETVGLTTIAS